MPTMVLLRAWVPDRPGALGAVASRIGAVGGDVVGIDILERGAGRAVDELWVELGDPGTIELLVAEVSEVDGVDVEDCRSVDRPHHNPALYAFERARALLDEQSPQTLLVATAAAAVSICGGDGAVVIALQADSPEAPVVSGTSDDGQWLVAFARGAAAGIATSKDASDIEEFDDLALAVMPAASRLLAVSRRGLRFRASERETVHLLADVADHRYSVLSAD